MTPPTISVIIPTMGRAGLECAFASIRSQVAVSDVEILCVADTYNDEFAAALARVPALCQQYAARYLECAGAAHMVGHVQRNMGMRAAKGAWLLFGQDDNRIVSDAWPQVRQIAATGPRVPHVWQVALRTGQVVPRERSLAYGQCDADGFMVPNDPARLGVWDATVYHGDWRFIEETVGHYDGAWEFVPQVLARGQPDA